MTADGARAGDAQLSGPRPVDHAAGQPDRHRRERRTPRSAISASTCCTRENRQKLSFLLREDGYDERLADAGWDYRRMRVAYERAVQRADAADRSGAAPTQADGRQARRPIRRRRPAIPTAACPAILTRATPPADGCQVFDEAKEQHTGVILGLMIASVRHRDADGKVRDYFLCRPGDDVESDVSHGAAVRRSRHGAEREVHGRRPLRKQDERVRQQLCLRAAGGAAATAGHDRSADRRRQRHVDSDSSLRPGADLNAVRDKLLRRFPADQYPYRIRDLEGPAGPAAGGRADGNDDPEHPAVPDHRRGRLSASWPRSS